MNYSLITVITESILKSYPPCFQHYTNLNEIYQRINSEEISSHGADYLAMMSSPSYVNTCPENENPGGYLSMSGPSTSPDERDSNGIELKPMLPRQPQSGMSIYIDI